MSDLWDAVMRWMAVLAVVMLSACVPGQGASDPSSAAPEASPLAAELIETTSLDAPAAQPAPASDEVAPAGLLQLWLLLVD